MWSYEPAFKVIFGKIYKECKLSYDYTTQRQRKWNLPLNQISNAVNKKNIGLNRDKTSNFLRRFVVNVIICTLATDTPGQSFLLNSEILAKTNNSNMEKLFDN